MADSRDSRARDEDRSEGRRPRSRSPSDPAEEERRRQRRRREREERSESPRDKRSDDRRDKRSTKDRSSRLREDDDKDHRSSRDSSERERRHRESGGERHTSDRHGHDRRTHRDDDRHHESRHRRRHSRSPRRHSRSPRRDRHRESRPRSESPKKIEAYQKAAGPLPDQNAAFNMTSSGGGGGGRGGSGGVGGYRCGGGGQEMVPHSEADVPVIEKQLPNFAPTGVLAAATNTIEKSDGSKVLLKYHEPPEARKPAAKDQWKLFVFKGKDIVDTIPLAERSVWLVGRDLGVVDLPAEHPSVSKQHAVVQFRWVEKKNEYGDRVGRVKPYLLDLESANGTFLNGQRIEESRFVEIRDKDLIKFGESTREYVVMLPPKE